MQTAIARERSGSEPSKSDVASHIWRYVRELDLQAVGGVIDGGSSSSGGLGRSDDQSKRRRLSELTEASSPLSYDFLDDMSEEQLTTSILVAQKCMQLPPDEVLAHASRLLEERQRGGSSAMWEAYVNHLDNGARESFWQTNRAEEGSPLAILPTPASHGRMDWPGLAGSRRSIHSRPAFPSRHVAASPLSSVGASPILRVAASPFSQSPILQVAASPSPLAAAPPAAASPAAASSSSAAAPLDDLQGSKSADLDGDADEDDVDEEAKEADAAGNLEPSDAVPEPTPMDAAPGPDSSVEPSDNDNESQEFAESEEFGTSLARLMYPAASDLAPFFTDGDQTSLASLLKTEVFAGANWEKAEPLAALMGRRKSATVKLEYYSSAAPETDASDKYFKALVTRFGLGSSHVGTWARDLLDACSHVILVATVNGDEVVVGGVSWATVVEGSLLTATPKFLMLSDGCLKSLHSSFARGDTWRRRGLGFALVLVVDSIAARQAARLGCSQRAMELDRPQEAKRFYDRLGFGESNGAFLDRVADVVLRVDALDTEAVRLVGGIAIAP